MSCKTDFCQAKVTLVNSFYSISNHPFSKVKRTVQSLENTVLSICKMNTVLSTLIPSPLSTPSYCLSQIFDFIRFLAFHYLKCKKPAFLGWDFFVWSSCYLMVSFQLFVSSRMFITKNPHNPFKLYTYLTTVFLQLTLWHTELTSS